MGQSEGNIIKTLPILHTSYAVNNEIGYDSINTVIPLQSRP